MLSGASEINSAFSAPPHQYQALERPGIRLVAINAALREALDLVGNDPGTAARMYIETTGEKIDPALALKTIAAPGSKFEATPRRHDALRRVHAQDRRDRQASHRLARRLLHRGIRPGGVMNPASTPSGAAG